VAERKSGQQHKTLRSLLAYGIRKFETAGIVFGHGTTNALDEAAWLILHAVGLPLDELNPHLDKPLPDGRYKAAKALLDERVRTRKPAAYLIHEAWLGPHRFYVDERVIVPRSFIAELLEEKMGSGYFFDGAGSAKRKSNLTPFSAASGNRGLSPVSILDLCTGSGCLAILAALRFPEAKVEGADLSDDALEVAKRNVADYKLKRRVKLVKSDLFSALQGRTYDLIVSNPPYVKAAAMRKLPDEYRAEPDMALASGSDGLDHTRVILREAKRHLTRDGVLMVEIGHNRKALERAFPALPFEWRPTSAGDGFVFTLRRGSLPSRAGDS
jgi:ribosomal protein L3 glutamine methyltransferase